MIEPEPQIEPELGHVLSGTYAEKISDVGEFDLIARIVERLGPGRSDTVVGAGLDDTAVMRRDDGLLQLFTIDSQVSGVHFTLDGFAPEDVGRKLAASNLSDVAAMGGSPTHAVAALCAPADLGVDFVMRMMDGLVSELSRWGAELVGGNLARSDRLVVDLALLGQVEEKQLLLRSGAQPGDAVLVTGHVGAAAAGMALMTAEHDPSGLPPEHRQDVLARQRWPEPRLEIGALLGERGGTAAIDVSDGLAADLGHICDASGVGVRIEASRLPISPATRAIAEALDLDLNSLALEGGEDYELVFTARPESIDELRRAIASVSRVPISTIGSVTAKPERVLTRESGAEQPLGGGWQHFGGRP